AGFPGFLSDYDDILGVVLSAFVVFRCLRTALRLGGRSLPGWHTDALSLGVFVELPTLKCRIYKYVLAESRLSTGYCQGRELLMSAVERMGHYSRSDLS